MPLTSRQFHEMIGSLRSDPLFGRRESPRVGVRLRLRITPCVDAPPVRHYDAWLRDMSSSGACLIGPVEMPVGSFFVARISRDKDAAPMYTLFGVVRCHKRGDKVYEIGARIERVLSEAEINGG